MRVFSMYEPYSRAAPERRMLALARVIPITPIRETIVTSVAVIINSMVENPPPVRNVCLLALLFCMPIVVVQKSLWSKSKDHNWPIEQSWCHKSSPDKVMLCKKEEFR